jgi:hypothetical protein
MSENKSMGNNRTRNWTAIVYPDSAPENWRNILNCVFHLPWVESPLHDKDLNPTGEEKKAHWHVLLMFKGVKTFEQVKEITDKINAPIPQKCANAHGLIRYMLHWDNPEKTQYLKSDIVCHGGADIAKYLQPTHTARYELIAEMMGFIDDNEIDEIKTMLDYARSRRMEDWFPLLCDNSAYIIGEYIKSNRHRKDRKPPLEVVTDIHC